MLLQFRERLVQVSAINRNYHLSDQSSPSFTIATCFLIYKRGHPDLDKKLMRR